MSQVVATFTGVFAVKSAVVPRYLGFLPSPAVLICNPQTTLTIPAIGTLTLFFGGSGIGVNVTDMKVDYATLHATMRGHVMVIRLLDRRWRWKFLPVSGRYNVRLPDGSIDSSTQKSAQELGAILLNAMHEPAFNVSVLPTDYYPEVDWNQNIAAVELSAICDECACDVSLNWDNSVSIVRLGVGFGLPGNADLQDGSVTGDPPEGPNKLLLVCGETQFQARLKLEAVGIDTDGSIKLIDDLSYKPSGGWDNLGDDSFFEQMGEEGKTAEEIGLARTYIFKLYQITKFADDTLNLPGYGTISDIRQIFPLNDWRIQVFDSAVGARKMRKPTRVFGTFVRSGDPNKDENTDDCTQYEGGYTIDPAGFVLFRSRVFKYHEVTTDEVVKRPADLTLETSFGLRDYATGQQLRKTFEYVFSPGVMQEVINQEELALRVVAEYSGRSCSSVTNVTDNSTELQANANTILNLHASRYAGAVYGSGKYRGLQPFNTSGTIRQVVFYADDVKGINTVASYNSEVGSHIIRAAARRRRRIIEMLANLNRARNLWSRVVERGLAR